MNTEEKIIQVPIEDIIPNRFQPRLAFDEEGLKELSESIKQHGIIQPLVLRRLGDKYEIIDDPPKVGKDVNDFLCKKLGINPKKNRERER